MFVKDAFAELDRRSTRRKLRRDAAQHESARQTALGALAEAAAQAGVLAPAEQQAMGQVAGQHGALAQHVAGLTGEIARLEAQRNAMIAGNAPQPQIAEVDKTLYRLRGELAQKSSHASAASSQRAAVLAQIGTAVYARGGQLGHVPQLGPAFAHIAQIDQALAGTAQQLAASTAASAAAPKGSVGKLFGAIAVLGIGGIVAIAIATSQSATKTEAKSEAKTTSSSSSSSSSSSHDAPIDAAAKRMDPVPPLSADSHVTEDGVQRTVKLNMTPEAVRTEGEEDGKKFIFIVRHDRHVMWMLSPDTQTYSEEQLSPDVEAELAPPAALQHGCLAMEGSDKIAGYDVKGQMCTFKIANKDFVEYRWAADALGGLVVKLQRGTMVTELAKIELGPQDPALFELPAGYHQ